VSNLNDALTKLNKKREAREAREKEEKDYMEWREKERATENWNMTPGTYLRKYILRKLGRKSGGRRSCKNGTRRHSKKKGTRRRQGMN
jgi:hypothetical protein